MIQQLPWERDHVTHLTGGWVGSRASMNMVVEKEIPAPTSKSAPILQPIASHYTNYVSIILKHIQHIMKKYYINTDYLK